MGSRTSSLRRLLSLFVAVVFAIVVTPGSMAMPAPQPMKMDAAAMAVAPCDHMNMQNTQKEHGKPCKGMAVCLGMLSCFGMAAMAVTHVTPLPAIVSVRVTISHQTSGGLTLQPDNPPPIV